MKITIKFKEKIIVEDVLLADNFWSKLTGYMFRKTPHVPGILFESPGPMQTTFMNFNLDLVFLTIDDQVVKVLRNVKPWRHTWYYAKTKKVLEVPAGLIPIDVKPGDKLEIIKK